jgi:ABC-type polysaccharide/polyol phosphate transport system ATPase subunit
MSMIDVRFDQVSKRYRLRESGPWGRVRKRDFWAVKDITLDVPHGETLGLIGHNGAGKSTLLKLLSRITAPTTGTITLNGRLAALIEVGSGFHPELSGRENLFLSGSMLGMRRSEIAAKLDRIIAFSGVGSFIDTPVKWYSSGMYVRLGFSVAAHLDADVLLVDEVLAVGDAAFQAQCFERIGDLRRAGTTMIFISHDLASVGRLCDRVALMRHGQVIASGNAAEVIKEYQRQVETAAVREVADASAGTHAAPARILDVRFLDEGGCDVPSTATGGRLRARVDVEVTARVPDATIEVFYYSRDGRTLHCQHSTALSGEAVALEPGRRSVEFTCAEFGLQPGVYAIGAAVRERLGPGAIDWWYGTRFLYVDSGKSVRGYFYAPHEWRWVDADEAERRPADV